DNAMDVDGEVYLGVWTNWSRGSSVMGATLTMTRQNGNLLIAFTAFFVPFVAARFWLIFALWFHQYFSTSDLRDTIYHQRQIVLRNASSPESGIISLIRLLWAWRKTGRRLWLRILPLILFTLLSIGSFTAAGGFSSHISTSGEVRLKGDNCEISASNTAMNLTEFNAGRADTAAFINAIASYSQQCSSNQTSNLLVCSRFVTSSVPTAAMDYHAPCPWNPESCRRTSSNVRFDTGHLNTNDVFGLNSPKEETMTFRYVLQCAPLALENRSFPITASDHGFTAYNFGPMFTPQNRTHNYTLTVPNLETQYARVRDNILADANFILNFAPDPAIMTTAGDVSLLFLSGNGLLFLSPTDDDWYRATTSAGKTSDTMTNDKQDIFRSDEAASPLGCIQQFQFCRDPAKGQCGDLGGKVDAIYSAAKWFNMTSEDLEPERPIPKTRQGSLLLWINYLLSAKTALEGLIPTLGPTALASQSYVTSGFVTMVQHNQWQLDVKRWWDIMLVGFQATFVSAAQGSSNLPSRPSNIKPSNEYDWDVCRNQKIPSAQYTSFSVFGLVFIYSMGAFIVIFSFIIESILRCLQKRGNYNKYAYLEWEGDTSIQLLRVAQEGSGHGQWSCCDETIPITRPDDLLAPFDISNPKHPMLAHTVDTDTVEEAKQGNTRQYESNGQPSERRTLENNNERSSGFHSAGVRRARSDAYADILREDRSRHSNEASENKRPGTAP
ncbi:hypothetical protein PG990_010846, partial [Apiospora arundinis]